MTTDLKKPKKVQVPKDLFKKFETKRKIEELAQEQPPKKKQRVEADIQEDIQEDAQTDDTPVVMRKKFADIASIPVDLQQAVVRNFKFAEMTEIQVCFSILQY